MTQKEAINELEYQEDMRSKGIDYQVNNLVIKTAILALEKQIPKKPVYYKEEHREEYTYSKREFYKCPLCNNALFIQNHKEKTYKGCGKVVDRYPQGNRTKHCCFCGQAIDWSDKE